MLTIPANMQTALKKNPNQEFRYIIKMGRSLIANPYTASNFYFSSNATFGALNVGITDTSVYPVVPILLKEPQITENLNLREHKSTIGGFSLDLDDNFLFQNPANSNALEKFSDQLNIYNIYNKDLYIYLWLPGLTNLQTECLEVYKGVVNDFKVNRGVVNIAISNSTFTVQKELPQTLISTSDGDYVPAENIGKPKKLVYGDHPFYYGQDGILSNITHLQNNTLIKCDYLGINAAGNHVYSIAEHALHTTNAAQYRAWMYDIRLRRFVKIDTTQVAYTGGLITIDNLPFLYDYWFPDGTLSGEANVGAFTDWANDIQSCNLDYSDYSYSFIDTDSNVGHKAYIEIDYPTYDGYQEDADIISIQHYGKSNFSETGAGDYAFRIIPPVNATGFDNTTLNLYFTEAPATKADIAVSVPIEHEMLFDQNESTAYVYMLFKEIKYQSTEMFPVFIACKGRKAIQIVADHFPEHPNAGHLEPNDLMENPAHVADSIIYEELGITVDTTSFSAVAVEQDSWKIAPVIDKQQNSKDIIDKIAKQAMSFVYWNATNKAAMDTFFAANTTKYTFQTNDIKNRPLLYKSPLKNIVNDFVLKYKKDGNSGNLQSTVERANSTANTGSQAVYNAVMDKVMDADFISDSATAVLLANHWCKDNAVASFWSVLHNIIEFETVDLRGVNFWIAGAFKPILALELTDIIELHVDWDAKMELFGSTWANKQFKIFSITRLPDTLKIKAFSL